MRLFSRSRDVVADRVAWQCASLLLSYPDADRLRVATELIEHAEDAVRQHLRQTLTAITALEPMRAAQLYVETFDLRRRATLYLTYWTAGDTRNRGQAMLAFSQAYRDAGAAPPAGEAPDHLVVVLEFAATRNAELGRQLLAAHRTPLDVVHRALCDTGSPYAPAVAAVLTTLPPASDDEIRRARRLAADGPPAEAVGLAPFTLTVPPRRAPEGVV